jgi:hypothetical protein
MWQVKAPQADEDLRQGDLIDEFLAPELKLPLVYGTQPGETAVPGSPILLKAQKIVRYLLVTPCCTISNYGSFALAPLSKTRYGNDAERSRLMEADETIVNDYLFRQHGLDPIDGLLVEDRNLLNVADLTRIVTYTGDSLFLRERRRASMSPEGRRLLRMRLGSFWSRPEESDAKYLKAAGIPVGVADPIDVTAAPETAS